MTNRRQVLLTLAATPATPVLAGVASAAVPPRPAHQPRDGVDHALGNHPQYSAPMGFGRQRESLGDDSPIDPQLGG